MNSLSKNMMALGVALFAMQNVCAMDYDQLGKEIHLDENYMEELMASCEQQKKEEEKAGIYNAHERFWNAVKNPRPYKKVDRTLPRTSKQHTKGKRDYSEFK